MTLSLKFLKQDITIIAYYSYFMLITVYLTKFFIMLNLTAEKRQFCF